MGKCNFKVGDKVRVKESEHDFDVENNRLQRDVVYTVQEIFGGGCGTLFVEGPPGRRSAFPRRFELVEAAPPKEPLDYYWDITAWEEVEDETRDSLLAKIRYFENEMSCYIQIAEMRKQHINELEKENEELKEELWVAAYGENYGE